MSRFYGSLWCISMPSHSNILMWCWSLWAKETHARTPLTINTSHRLCSVQTSKMTLHLGTNDGVSAISRR